MGVDKKELVLVTGGAGFIGSHLVDALIKEGLSVRVLDNLAPPTHNNKLPSWFNKKAEFIKRDVRWKKDWLRSLVNVNYIFHLASYMDYHLDFSTYFDANVKSTALMYEIIVKRNLPIKKIIVASSQSVYGEGKYFCDEHGVFYPKPRIESRLKEHLWDVVCPKDGKPAKLLPEKETDELRPQTPYAISKMASERLALILGRIYDIPSVALRYSIVQGSRQSFRHFYSGALKDFSVRAIAGKPIVMQEDAKQIRDFVNIHDVVDAHLAILKDDRANYQAFNVGSGRTTRVIDLAKAVCKAAKVPFRPVIDGLYRIRSPRHSKMDISKLKKLGWRPKRTLKDSVKEYVDWIKAHPEAIKYWRKTYREMKRSKILKT